MKFEICDTIGGQNQYPDSGEWFELQGKNYPYQRKQSLLLGC